MAIRPGLLLLAGAGGVLLWSGIKGKSVTSVFRQLIGGDAPTTATNANTIVQTSTTSPTSGGSESTASATGNTGASSPSAAANQALAKVLAIAMGYPQWAMDPTQWDDWVSLWNQESGWNINAANPSSNARGIAQNINGYNNTDYLEGNARSQITWGINYIASRYGSPSAAWTHEVQNNWY
jgi:resuscitation-promoting factor RpfB